MKKQFIFFPFMAAAITAAAFTSAHAQLSTFSNAQKAAFMALGGYAYTETEFPTGGPFANYVRSGASPETPISFTATASGGIYNAGGALSTDALRTPISMTFLGNNIRKFGAEVFGSSQSGTPIAGTVQVTATTNLGYTGTLNCDLNNRFAGFQVTGENEYITSIVFTPPVTGTIWASADNLILGDDKPQNTALNLDGVDDHVVIPNTVGNFTTAQDFSVSLWVKPNATQINSTENDIISKWDGNGNYPFVIRYFNENHPDSKGQVFAGQWDGANFSYGFSGVSINDGQWHHVSLTKSGITFKLYIDGILRSTFTDITPNATDNTTPLFLGRRGDGNNHFKGEIDEVRLRNVALTEAEVQNDMYCQSPSLTNLPAAYNFNEGVPNGNNELLTQVNNITGNNHGTLTNMAKTGDSSNFVTGKVRYVKADAVGANNGSSWANAYTSLQSALAVPAGSTCNDLMDVWVAKGTYKPHPNDVNAAFTIPSAYRLYGGFAGTEASINQRNPALLLTTNLTRLSGDLSGNDTPNFGNRSDNSKQVVTMLNVSGNILDGFEVRGAANSGMVINNSTVQVDRCKLTDNQASSGGGAYFTNSNILLSRCMIMGNSANVGGGFFLTVTTGTKNTRVLHCLITGNKAIAAGGGVLNKAGSMGAVNNISYTNCTIAGNDPEGMRNEGQGGTVNIPLANAVLHGNGDGIITNNSGGGSTSTTIIYSLVQGVTTGTGNLNGNTVNPNFMDLPAFSSAPTTAGDFHLKWCSTLINAGINPTTGNNAGQLPLDLDRTPTPFNTNYDIGAYEYLGNTPSGTGNAAIAGAITSGTYAGTGPQSITSTAKIIAPAGAIDFKASNSITLNPGFEASGVSKYFKAQIGANVACSN
ncbi:LamG domain-containing protein [Runella sp.]|uniref:LamG domain-containing protein n=1 Tax=Runella sp. TaxID=1960881 RepID=UPI003D1120D8